MLGSRALAPHTRRASTAAVGFALAMLVVLACWGPAAARASGCENSWAKAENGSWYTATSWSKKTVPAAGEEVCIAEPGTYTVELKAGAPVTVKTLKLGATSGTQTLAVESSGAANAFLTTEGLTIAEHGALTMTNGDGAGDNVTVTGPIANAGTITSVPANGGTRSILGNLTNTGTIQINTATAFSGEKAVLTNEGSLNIAEGKVLTLSNHSSALNGTGGKILANSGADLLAGSGTTFTQGAGATSGTLPVIVDDATLAYTGAGAGSIAIRGTSALSGNLSTGQALQMQSTGSENATVTAAGSFSSAGAITLTNGDGSGNNVTFVIASGTFSNSGTLTSELASAGGRTIEGNVTNTGTIQINTATSFNGEKATLSNEGTLNIASTKSLTLSNHTAAINGAGGKIVAASSTANLLAGPGTSFTEGAGTTSGALPVIVDDGALVYTGSGASVIAERGAGTLAGNLSSGQTLQIQSTGGENAVITAAANVSNAGAITLTNGDGSGNNETLILSAGSTLTNSGTLTSELASGGGRTIQGNVTNTGTIQVNTATSYSGESAQLKNQGTLALAEGKTLTVSNKGVVTNGSGGKINATGTGSLLAGSGTAFIEEAGTTSGTLPVIVDDGTLTYAGKGASTIALRGTSTLSGAINSGQTLSIQSTGSENALANAASFLNSGTIVLTNGDGAGNGATLNLAGGTLENKGTLSAEAAHGGARTIEGSLTNEKTLLLSAGVSLKVTGAYTQGKKGIFKTAIASATTFGALSVGGAATLGGSLTLVPAKGLDPALGSKLAVLTAGSRSGVFAKVKGSKIKIKKGPIGVYYDPVYSASGLTLLVAQAALTVTPGEGAPGSTVKLSGSALPGEDKIKLAFADAKKAKTTFTTVTTNSAGEFSVEVSIPAAAATGNGTFTETSTETGVAQTATFKVT
jgi:predicted ribosome-associated RNA-binding protein Tma20